MPGLHVADLVHAAGLNTPLSSERTSHVATNEDLDFHFLDMSTVRQNERQQVAGARRFVYRPFEPGLEQLGQETRVVNVCMRLKDKVRPRRIERKGPAVDFLSVLGPCNGPQSIKKVQPAVVIR